MELSHDGGMMVRRMATDEAAARCQHHLSHHDNGHYIRETARPENGVSSSGLDASLWCWQKKQQHLWQGDYADITPYFL